MNSKIYNPAGAIYLVPFIFVFLVYGLSMLHTEPGQESSTVNQVMYSSAYLSAFFILISKQRQFFYYTLARSIPLLMLLFLGLISFVWSDFPRNVLVGFAHKTGTILVAICVTNLLIQNKTKFFEVLLVVFFLYFIATIIFAHLRPDIANMPASLYGKYRAGLRGLTPHPNTLGGICVIGAWVAFCSLFLIDNTKKKISFLATLVLLLLFYCLIRANSMTSIMVSLGIGAIIIWFRFIKSPSNEILILKILIAIIGLLMAISILFLFKPEIFSIEYFFKSIGRDSSFTGRASLWDMGLRGFYAKPFFGWSEDNLFTYLRYYHQSFAQFHNGYLDFLVRSGLVSFFLFTLMLFKVIKYLITSPSDKTRNYIIIMAFLLPWLVHNITEASIYRNTHLLWYVFLICYFFSIGYKFQFNKKASTKQLINFRT